jgi:transcriptional regulator with XRE-family HTH domain
MTENRFDHQLVADFVAVEWPDHARSLTDFSRRTGVSVTTLRRLMKDGDPSIKPATLRAVERGLEVPPRTLDLIRSRDMAGLRLSGLADLPTRWLSQRIREPHGTGSNHSVG